MDGDDGDLRRGTWTWFPSLEWQPCDHSTFPPLKTGQLESHITGCGEACAHRRQELRLPSAHHSFMQTFVNEKPW